MKRCSIVAYTLLAVIVMAGCGTRQAGGVAPTAAPAPTAAATIPAVTISARDFAFDMPDSLPSGWVALTFRNDGKINHHGLVMRLKDGVTVAQVLTAMGQEGAQPPVAGPVTAPARGATPKYGAYLTAASCAVETPLRSAAFSAVAKHAASASS